MDDALRVDVTKVREGAKLPCYATSGSAGADLCACITEALVIDAGSYSMVPTGLSMAIPYGYEAQVRPRSGLAAKFGLTVLNSPGTIDADYRGEINVLLVNLGKKQCIIQPGDRIAQLVIAPCVQANFNVALALGATERGQGGFGSTGV